MKYQVLITTSGLGHRLGDITKFTNKSLVRVGKKPAISYIVEAYPDDVELVITLGHYGDQVRQFLGLAYPNRKITYVEVDNYEGPGSSLAYSILQAKKIIEGPFIFHACDTLVTEKIPAPDKNWLGGYPGAHQTSSSANYVTFDTNYNGVTRLRDKGDLNYDYTYIGLAGIYNYSEFFSYLEEAYQADPNNGQLSDIAALRRMLNEKLSFSSCNFEKWLDIGNADGLKHARENVKDKFEILDKLGESIFIFQDEFIVKFFHDKEICSNRIKRAEILQGLVPEILGYTDNFYKYKFAKGNLMAQHTDEYEFGQLLKWAHEKLWIPKDHNSSQAEWAFEAQSYDFYFRKTKQRLKKFLEETGIQDDNCTINNIDVCSIENILDLLDSKWLCSGIPTGFHGDFILDNILCSGLDSFTLLDWRQDFGGQLERGDLYYDLAKLNHNLIFNHDIVNKNLFEIKLGDKVFVDILRSHNLTVCQDILRQFIKEKGLDQKKVNVLTALIWINMAALHHYPLNMFLFYFGKLNLFKSFYDLS